MSTRSRPKAVRAMCIDCMGDGANVNTPSLIRECSVERCPLRPVRPYIDGRGRRPLEPAIRAMCFHCAGENADPGPKLRVRDCPRQSCPLHPVRPWQGITGRRRDETTEAAVSQHP